MAHCPRCGQTLALQPDGRMRCATGEMLLTAQLTDEIQRFAAGDQIEITPITFPIGGAWHCPSDGTQLDEKDSRLYCTRCTRFVPARIWYQVVEYHRHR